MVLLYCFRQVLSSGMKNPGIKMQCTHSGCLYSKHRENAAAFSLNSICFFVLILCICASHRNAFSTGIGTGIKRQRPVAFCHLCDSFRPEYFDFPDDLADDAPVRIGQTDGIAGAEALQPAEYTGIIMSGNYQIMRFRCTVIAAGAGSQSDVIPLCKDRQLQSEHGNSQNPDVIIAVP